MIKLAAQTGRYRVPTAAAGRACASRLQSTADSVRLTVNNNPVSVPLGSTILDAIKRAGASVPLLCHHPRFPPKSVCRMCLVEVTGEGRLVPACSTQARDGSAVITDSKDLVEFRRKEAQLLLARHPNDCMRCEVSGNCKLQSFVQTEELEEVWPKRARGDPEQHPEHRLHDHTSPALYRDMDKCIECGLCVQACGPAGQNQNIIGFAERGTATIPVTIFDRELADTNCISCGQCTVVCPVGALTERPDWHRVMRVLDGRRTRTVVQVAPATRIAIAEEFGLEPGSVQTGRLVHALRALGFDFVFDTNFTADLTIMEEASELLRRVGLRAAAAEAAARGASERDPAVAAALRSPLPQFTSCCPGWINWIEIHRPDLLRHLSTTKSPQGMLGALAKRGLFPASKELNAPRETYNAKGNIVLEEGGKYASGEQEVFVVSVMPCTAKKEEGARPGLAGDVDAVVTTRELARMIRSRRIPFASLPNDGVFDSPLGESTGAAVIFGASGGVMEAALRTAAYVLAKGAQPEGADPPDTPIDFHSLRGELPGVKVATVAGVGDVAVCNGIAAAQRLLSNDAWRDQFVAIEVMTCVGGCLGGGGEPKSDDPKILEKRTKGIFRADESLKKRCSHENEAVQKLYDDFLGHPLSHTSERLLHTTFSARHSDREILARFLSAVDQRNGRLAAALFSERGASWDTNTEAFGEVRGQESIEELINKKLPPIKLGSHFQRHRFVDAAQGTTVLAPSGEVVDFDVRTEGAGSSLRITRLVRRPRQT